MKMFRKRISILLVLVMVLSTSITALAGFKDTNTHWANKEISYFAEKGILDGYPDGTFKPENNVKRVEVYKIINQVMGYTEKSKVDFLDVKSSDWFYKEVAKGLKAGYIKAKEGGNLNPNIAASREEVAIIIGIAFGLEKDKSDSAKVFLDEKKISKEGKGYISILKDNKYIEGYPDGNFKPDGLITRAEVSKMVNNITGEIFNEAGSVSKDIEGNLLVNTGGSTLNNMLIKGNLYLTEGVGDGSLKLNNVKVEGQIINLSKKGKIIIDETITDKIPVNSITVTSKDDLREINTEKGTLDMLVNVEPSNATNKEVVWSVTNTEGAVTSKATIDQKGLLTAVESGIVKVKATSLSNPAISDKIEIEIKGQPIPSTIIFTEPGPLAKITEDKSFINKVTGGEGNGEITYTSGTPAVATVDKNTGEVSILAVGTTVITARKAATKTHGEVTNTYGINVTVNKVLPSTIIFEEGGPISKTIGDKTFINKVIGGEGDGEITYTSETPAVATVNKTTGEVDVLAVGTTLITGRKAATKTHGEVVSVYKVNVQRKPITPITKIEIIGKESVGSELIAEITPKDATVSYQWKKMQTNPVKMENIPGATENKYTPTHKDAGWMIVAEANGIGTYSGRLATNTKKISKIPLLEPIINQLVKATDINAGQTLGNSTLSGSFKDISNKALTGKLVWSDPTIVVNKTGDYRWVFESDSPDYSWLKGNVSVKANPVIKNNPDFSGGSGTLADPYKVSNAHELDKVRNYLDKHFIQTKNFYINFEPFNTGQGWLPIGNPTNKFTGTYNGQGYKIEYLTIKAPESNSIGLFGYTSTEAKLSNITMSVFWVTGGQQVGVLVGHNDGQVLNCMITHAGQNGASVQGLASVGGMVGYNQGTIDGCTSYSNRVRGKGDIGGLVGTNINGVIKNSNSNGYVYGENNIGVLVGMNQGQIYNCYTKNGASAARGLETEETDIEEANVGGLVGANAGNIENCYADTTDVNLRDKSIGGGLVGYNAGHIYRSYTKVVNVSGRKNDWAEGDDIGGLVGLNLGTIDECCSINDSYFKGLIDGRSRIGGLVGSNKGGIINSYSTAIVKGRLDVGGLIGKNYGKTITNTYAKGSTYAPEKYNGEKAYTGGLIGYNEGGKVNNCYFDKESTGQNDDKKKGSPQTTAEMTSQATFKDWDFTSVWNIDGNSYPYLRWQNTEDIPRP